MNRPYIPENDDFIEAGMKAWNFLTLQFDNPEECTLYNKPSDFEEFYTLVMNKILEEEEAE